MSQIKELNNHDGEHRVPKTKAEVLTWSAFILAITWFCMLLSACDGPKTSVLAESRSPDGKLIARARATQPSGIGTGNIGTFVDLNWTNGSQNPTTILSFDDGSDYPGDKTVGLNWLSPTHLEVTYKGQRTIDFEAIKCHGVEITIRPLS
jgi:hypothetical protein